VALEAHFSAQGARQLQTDVEAVCSVFRPYTSRPQAVFKPVQTNPLSCCCWAVGLSFGQGGGTQTRAVGKQLCCRPGMAVKLLWPAVNPAWARGNLAI
jgi:hypothetical protein